MVPYGLKNAPPFFQRTMDSILAGLSHARCYIDDIINWSTTFDDHILHLQKKNHRCRKQRLKIHPGKSLFFAEEMDFLGHRITQHGLTPQK